jgi:ABC-2 type transport system ATP-binding protein
MTARNIHKQYKLITGISKSCAIIMTVLQSPPPNSQINLMNDFALQVCGLTKYFGTALVVNNLSLAVTQGEIFGFLGPNGAGKTTSINMMVGLLEPTSGEVFIEGQPIRGRRADVFRRIGVCPQETTLWEKLTCLEQLEFVGANYNLTHRQARANGRALLDALGLAAKVNELAGRLSGGMKRRLNLALALVHDPQLVFLDEPEAGLDPQSRVLVRDTIRYLARKKTVVLTTHNMDEAERLADRVAIIDRGQLLVVDTPAMLKRRLGEGSVLELELGGRDGLDLEPNIQTAIQDVQRLFPDALYSKGILTVRGQDLAARLPELLQTIRAAEVEVGDMHMRSITLEDVFLSLTGRGLRE